METPLVERLLANKNRQSSSKITEDREIQRTRGNDSNASIKGTKKALGRPPRPH